MAFLIIVVLIFVAGYYGFLKLSGEIGLDRLFSPNSREDREVVEEEPRENSNDREVRIGVSKEPLEAFEFSASVTPPEGFEVSDLSPQYGDVVFSSVRRQFSPSSPLMFILRTRLSKDESVNISGWYITQNDGDRVVVPRAIAVYDARNFNSSDIVMTSGNEAHFFFNKSSSGNNLRLNKCTGYLNNIFDFTPTLPKQCPSIDRSRITTFTGECQNIVRSLGTCEEPSNEEMSSFVVTYDPPCRDFLNTINYSGCYNRNYSEANFFSNSWYVWLDSTFQLDPLHDRLLLFDQDGFLVDEYVY